MMNRKLAHDAPAALKQSAHHVPGHHRGDHHSIGEARRLDETVANIVPAAPAERLSRLHTWKDLFVPNRRHAFVRRQNEQNFSRFRRLWNRDGIPTLLNCQATVLIVSVADDDVDATIPQIQRLSSTLVAVSK